METNDVILISDRNGNVVGGVENGIAVNARSVLSQRLSLTGRHGKQFSNNRDLYTVLGYPADEPEYLDYLARYTRQDIAGTIVDFPAEETWRDAPMVRDGEEKDAEEDTPFETEWRALSTRLRAWQRFEQVDKMAGIGQYAVILIGVKGAGDLDEPVDEQVDAEQIIYLRAYDEQHAAIETYNEDAQSERFGMPETYKISFGTPGKTSQRVVHASRVIHVAENTLENDLLGRPRLQRVYNRLMDLEKIVGGSAEATWKLMRKGFVLDIDPNADIPSGDLDDLEDQIDEYDHGLRRFLKTRGMKAFDLGSEVVDPTGLVDVIISLVAATTGIPKRILMGSERGELASSQDAASWAGRIGRRREIFAEPSILFAFIDRLLSWRALPAPVNDEYSAEWKPLFELSEKEEAEMALIWAQAFLTVAQQAGSGVVTPEEFREQFTTLPAAIEAGALPGPDVLEQVAQVVGNAQDPYTREEALAMVRAAERVVARGW